MLSIKGYFKRIIHGKPSFKEFFSKKSYSQCGEDLIIDYLFRLRNIEAPSYIDIGANHPYYLSNTAFFYEKGLSGICIDPDPACGQLFSTHRSRDTFIQAGIAEKEGNLPFFIMSDNTLNTCSLQELSVLQKAGHKLIREISIPVFSLKHIIDKYCNGVFPDFLSLDVEGLDTDIIYSYDFKTSAPKVICIEVTDYSPRGNGKKRTEIYDCLLAAGYIEYASTYLNGIFVKEDFWSV